MVNLIIQPNTSNNVSHKKRRYINRLQETNDVYYQGMDAFKRFVNRTFVREIYIYIYIKVMFFFFNKKFLISMLLRHQLNFSYTNKNRAFYLLKKKKKKKERSKIEQFLLHTFFNNFYA